MKIDKPGTTLPNTPPEGVARGFAKDKAAQALTPQQPSGTSFSLGSTAAHLQGIEGSMANSPVVNAAKVAEIKQAISEGRFQVNTSLVADRLIATVHDLLGGKT